MREKQIPIQLLKNVNNQESDIKFMGKLTSICVVFLMMIIPGCIENENDQEMERTDPVHWVEIHYDYNLSRHDLSAVLDEPAYPTSFSIPLGRNGDDLYYNDDALDGMTDILGIYHHHERFASAGIWHWRTDLYSNSSIGFNWTAPNDTDHFIITSNETIQFGDIILKPGDNFSMEHQVSWNAQTNDGQEIDLLVNVTMTVQYFGKLDTWKNLSPAKAL